jgi:hypothetical protein
MSIYVHALINSCQPAGTYSRATLGLYEMTRVELLRDLYVWVYDRPNTGLGRWFMGIDGCGFDSAVSSIGKANDYAPSKS